MGTGVGGGGGAGDSAGTMMAVMGGERSSWSVPRSGRGRERASCKGVTVPGSGGAHRPPPTPCREKGAGARRVGTWGRISQDAPSSGWSWPSGEAGAACNSGLL